MPRKKALWLRVAGVGLNGRGCTFRVRYEGLPERHRRVGCQNPSHSEVQKRRAKGNRTTDDEYRRGCRGSKKQAEFWRVTGGMDKPWRGGTL